MKSLLTRVTNALKHAKTIEEVEYIEDQVDTHPSKPNYRTKQGREDRDKMYSMCRDKKEKLSKKLPPF